MPEKKKQELKDRAPIVAAYLRVSTDKQTILNQKSEVCLLYTSDAADE